MVTETSFSPWAWRRGPIVIVRIPGFPIGYHAAFCHEVCVLGKTGEAAQPPDATVGESENPIIAAQRHDQRRFSQC